MERQRKRSSIGWFTLLFLTNKSIQTDNTRIAKFCNLGTVVLTVEFFVMFLLGYLKIPLTCIK